MAKKKQETDRAGLLFVGCLLAGMGVGFVVGQLVGGLFIGMGIGFILMFYYSRK